MKNLLPWLKANLVSVISVAVALIAAPVAVFFALGWVSSIRAGVESDVSKRLSELSALDVTYSIPPYLAGQQPVDVKGAPNEATVQAVSTLLQRIVAETGQVREEAIAFNQRGKKPLIDGLFPNQPDESTRLRLLASMIRLYPEAHDKLLREFRGGTPPTIESVQLRVDEVRSKEIARRTSGRTAAQLTPEDAAQLETLLSEARLERYRSTANELSFYAAPAAFEAVKPFNPNELLPLETAWDWQFTYWVHADVIAAIAEANKDPVSGSWQPVYRAPIKIVESIAVRKPGEAPGGGGRGGRSNSSTEGDGSQAGGGGGGGGGGDADAQIQPNFTLSHTGRAAAPVAPNAVYDIRYVDLVVVVSSRHLPRVLAAFPKTNFITVVGVDMEHVPSLPLLERGYDVGGDHLVRATIRLETAWLRDWTKKFMPTSVRTALGIPEDPPPQENPEQSSSAPAPEQG